MGTPSDEAHTDPGDSLPPSAFAGYDAPADAGHSDEDTAELRLRIDETRAAHPPAGGGRRSPARRSLRPISVGRVDGSRVAARAMAWRVITL